MMNNTKMVEDLKLVREGIVRIGNNKYVINCARATNFNLNWDISVFDHRDCYADIDYIVKLDKEFEIDYDFSNLKYLKASCGTTYILIDRKTLKLKAFTDHEPDKVVDLYWNLDEWEYNELTEGFCLYKSLALKIQEILTYEYKCRESFTQVIEGFYTREEVLDMYDDIINHC